MAGNKAVIRRLRRNDQFHLTAAEGWLELGNWFEANEELEQIAPRMRAHPDVLHARYDVFSLAGNWQGAVEIARAVCELLPTCPFGYVKWARALHELKRTKEARDVLLPVVDNFPDEDIIAYNLARYACQLGNLKEAMQWLKKAIDLASTKEVKLMALDDPDLEPLWQQISEI